MFSSFTDGSYITENHLKQPLAKAIANYKECFFKAKRTCDAMNTDCNGRISFAEFRNYCLFNPQAIDFIARLTIGPYPPSQALQEAIVKSQTD